MAAVFPDLAYLGFCFVFCSLKRSDLGFPFRLSKCGPDFSAPAGWLELPARPPPAQEGDSHQSPQTVTLERGKRLPLPAPPFDRAIHQLMDGPGRWHRRIDRKQSKRWRATGSASPAKSGWVPILIKIHLCRTRKGEFLGMQLPCVTFKPRCAWTPRESCHFQERINSSCSCFLPLSNPACKSHPLLSLWPAPPPSPLSSTGVGAVPSPVF